MRDAMAQMDKMIADGVDPEVARQNAAARVNALRKANGLAPIDVSSLPGPAQPTTPGGKGRDKADLDSYLKYIQNGYGAEDAAKLVNRQRASEGLPTKDFSGYDVKTNQQREAEANRNKGDVAEAIKQFNELVRGGTKPEEAKRLALEIVNSGRRLGNQKDLDASAIPFPVPELKAKQSIDAEREKAKAEAVRRIGEAAQNGQDITASTLAQFNKDLKLIGAEPLTAEEVQLPKKQYTATSKGRTAELTDAGITDPAKEFEGSLNRTLSRLAQSGELNKILPGMWGTAYGALEKLNQYNPTGRLADEAGGRWFRSKMAGEYLARNPDQYEALQDRLVRDLQTRFPDASVDALKQMIREQIAKQ